MKFNKKWLWLIIPIMIFSLVCLNTSSVSTVLLAIQGAITDGNLVKFSGTNGIGVDTGLSASNVTKNKFDATSAPTANNDIDEGYTAGSRWLDTTNLKSYVCLDNTKGAAVWIENIVEGDMNKSTYDTDEDGDIDVAAGGTEKSLWNLYAIPYLSGTTAFGEITIGTAGQVLKVAAGATSYEFANESDPTVDTDAEIKAILVDEVTKTGTFTAGRIAKINNATGIIEMATNTDAQVSDAVTKAHTQNTDTQFDFYNALVSDHTWSGDKDTQLVGESVVFGDLLYFDWTDKEWKKTDADAAATMPGLRIALETKTDGQTCLMLIKGYIRDDDAFNFAASMVYANVTPGTMSSTAPTETGDQVQRVGVAKSADILFFSPSIDVGEI